MAYNSEKFVEERKERYRNKTLSTSWEVPPEPVRSISSGWFGLNHNYRLYQKGKFEIIKRSLKYDDVI